MEPPIQKQIYNKLLLIVTSSAVDPQQASIRIDVPFTVGKAVVHPVTRYVAVANVKTDLYVVQNPDINPTGTTNTIGHFVGDDTATPLHSDMIFTYGPNGKQFNGVYNFTVRSLAEVAGGASVPITAKILINVEFHEL